MVTIHPIVRRGALMVLGLALVSLLSAGSVAPPSHLSGADASDMPSHPERLPPYRPEVREAHRDDHGAYVTASEAVVAGGDDVEVGIEERLYVLLGQARFVVTHSNLERWTHTLGVSSARLTLTRDGEVISETDLLHVVEAAVIPSTIGASPAFESVGTSGWFGFGVRPTRICAHFVVRFATETDESLSLHTCE